MLPRLEEDCELRLLGKFDWPRASSSTRTIGCCTRRSLIYQVRRQSELMVTCTRIDSASTIEGLAWGGAPSTTTPYTSTAGPAPIQASEKSRIRTGVPIAALAFC